MLDGLRLTVTLFTVVPVRAGRVDRDAAGWAMTLAPLVGLLVGVAVAGVLAAGTWLGLGSLLSAALAVASVAIVTRGLHLDGLADTADGLGSHRPPAEALDIMKRSDIGPFGVVAIVLALLTQVAALAQATTAGRGPTAVVVAIVTGRLAATWACRRGVPAARPEGLGALVAGTVPLAGAAIMTTGAVLAAAAAGLADHAALAVVLVPTAIVAGLATAELFRHHVERRLGGVTGDALGAFIEVATTVALITLAIRPL